MELILILLAVQGVMGVFDLVYHHEITEKLTWKPGAADEMWLHGLRNGMYAVVFLSFGFFHWHGALAWAFLAILVTEVGITLTDFVLEDKTRKLPATERVAHTLLALNYGAVLGLFIPVFIEWQAAPTAFAPVYYGFLSWVMGIYAFGVFLWFFRDYLRSFRLRDMAAAPDTLPTDARVAGKRVLVTGGTGFIGAALCRSLQRSGAKVTVLTRDIENAAARFSGRIELVDDLSHLGPEDKFDIVINLAGEPIAQRWTDAAKDKILNSRLEMTQGLLDFMARTAQKPEVFISGSAIGWYGIHEQDDFDESSAPSNQPGGDFARHVCVEWEKLARKAEGLGIRTVILRTGVVLERDGGTLAELLFPFDFGFGGPMGSGRQWFSWIHRDDFIGLALYAAANDKISGVVNATAPEPVTNRTFATALGRAMKRPSLVPLPGFVLQAVFGRMADEVMLNGQKVRPKRAIDNGYVFRHPDIDAALGEVFAT